MYEDDMPFDWGPGTENAVPGPRLSAADRAAKLAAWEEKKRQWLAAYDDSPIAAWGINGEEVRACYSPFHGRVVWTRGTTCEGDRDVDFAGDAYARRPQMVLASCPGEYRLIDRPGVVPAIVGHVPDGSAWDVAHIGGRVYRVVAAIPLLPRQVRLEL